MIISCEAYNGAEMRLNKRKGREAVKRKNRREP
nr:MAG TPA: hypothetical protein [Bacteriophage sp.]